MALSPRDFDYMAQAIRLAEQGLYTTMPNPRVGCLIVVGEGVEDKIIGRGFHRKAGEGHAEVNALASISDSDRHLLNQATAYVTLEPCSHQGRTGPCSQALISAGVKRVVYAMEDPNPLVAGRGIEQLRAAGIEVDGPVLEDDARALNPGFLKRMEQKKPYVRAKLAMSLDGRTAMSSGESQWITGPKARSDVQRLRARSCAIISGADTVIQDSASLTVRADELHQDQAAEIASRQPLRVLIDSRLRIPVSAPIFRDELSQSPILLVHVDSPRESYPAHVELLQLPASTGKIDLRKLLTLLAERQINEVLIEAGPSLAGAFLRAGLLDEIIIYMAPKLMGSEARPLFDLPLQRMAGALPLKIVDIRAVGKDWRITAKPDTEY